MGVCINYRGRLKSPDRIMALTDEVRRLADERGWPHHEFSLTNRGVHAASPPSDRDEPDLSGITVIVHPKCEPLLLLFDAEGVLRNHVFPANDPDGVWCSVKTQYAPPDAHVDVVQTLKGIQSHFFELEVVDEGQYWDTADRELLVANLKALANLIDAAGEALKHAPAEGSLEDRIIAAMSNLGRDIKPN